MIKCRASFLVLWIVVWQISFAEDPISAESIVEKITPAIVAIRADTPEGIAAGTGFLVDPTGVVVTNLHVIEGATRATIKLHSGEQHTQIRVASFDIDRDLAVLRLPGFELPTVSLGNSDSLKVGATVYAIGNPLGLEESVTKGIVSSIRVLDDGTKVIQTDSAVSSGNSGGPLVNEFGEVVGVVTFKMRGGENINFAIPINYASALLGFETLISLDELATKLDKDETSLFADNDGELGGAWLSLLTNDIRTLKQDGDYVYGRWQFKDNHGTYDLKKQDDGSYKGIATTVSELWYTNCGNCPRVDVTCVLENEMTLRLVNPNRIEGEGFFAPFPESPRAQIKYVKSCGKSEEKNKIRQDFVWVRAD